MQIFSLHGSESDRGGVSVRAPIHLIEADNPLAGHHPGLDRWLADSHAPSEALLWSGTLADSLAAKDPMTWMSPGRAALRLFCDTLAPALAKSDRRVIFRPHCRHALSDATSAAAFLAQRAGQPFSVALEPASLLEPGMLFRWEDHLCRAFETLGPLCNVVILASPSDDLTPDSLPALRPIGEGKYAPDALARLVRGYCRPDARIVFLTGDAERQAAILGL